MADAAPFGTAPSVTLDGTPLRPEALRLLERVDVDTSVHRPGMFALRLRDPQHDVLSRLGFRLASTVTVSTTRTGDGSQREVLRGEITALEHDFGPHGACAVVRGYDVSHRLTRGRRTASYNDVTDGDVVRQVAQRAGLDAGRIDGTDITYPHVAQLAESDWDFLRRRAREAGREVVVVAGELVWRTPADPSTGPEVLTDRRTPPAAGQLVLGGNLRELRPRVTAAQQSGAVEVRGFDPATKDPLVGRAAVAADHTFGAPDHLVADRPVTTQAEAEAVALAVARRLAGVQAEAEGVADGDPSLVAGAAVSIGGAGHPFDGRYVLTSVRHTYDSRGYRTSFVASGQHDRSMLALTTTIAPSSLPGIVVAQVTDVDDPEQLARVKVSFPWLDDGYESWWAPLATIGAGADRGVIWLPEVGDEVLVAFAHGDRRAPYVIGSVWNGADHPPLMVGMVDGTTGAVQRRGLVSRTRQRLVLSDDDAAPGIQIATGDDHLELALDGSSTTIRVRSDGTVEITGSRGISISSDAAISVQAGTTLELKGSSGVTIDGGPNVQVTGSVIQLN